MKRINVIGQLVLLMMLFFTAACFGANIISIKSGTVEVENEGTSYSDYFNLAGFDFFGIEYQVTDNDGAITLKIELEEGDAPPTTALSADSAWTVPTVSDTSGIIFEATLTGKTKYLKPMTPVPSRYGRLKVTGNTGNITNTLTYKIIQIKVN